MTSPAAGPSRRTLLTGALSIAAGVGIGVGATVLARDDSDTAEAPAPGVPPGGPLAAPVDPVGATQAGIDRPATPQHHSVVSVLDLPADTTLGFLGDLGRQILALTAAAHPLLPDGPGSLTVTVGLGPRVVALHGAELPGAQELPEFVGDRGIDPGHRGGDLLISVCSEDPTVPTMVIDVLSGVVPGARPRWSQRGFRGPGQGTVVRNPLGFHDGIIVPRGAELAENVWLDGALAGATICVIRRLALDTARFAALSTDEQEAVIGRRRADGVPLSGGGPLDEVKLGLKTPDGEYLVPTRSHARAAHPSFTGSSLMFRRGYAYDNGSESGLLFVCFQNNLRTFVTTQQRLDENDDLMDYARPTASATFLILPGFTSEQELGAALQTLPVPSRPHTRRSDLQRYRHGLGSQ